jgi:hypothetical protein
MSSGLSDHQRFSRSRIKDHYRDTRMATWRTVSSSDIQNTVIQMILEFDVSEFIVTFVINSADGWTLTLEFFNLF